jgi:hypothetical protein
MKCIAQQRSARKPQTQGSADAIMSGQFSGEAEIIRAACRLLLLAASRREQFT